MTQRTKAFASRWVSVCITFLMCVALLPVQAEEVKSSAGALSADFGEKHGVAAIDGAVFTWGRNTYGQLGTGSLSDVSKAAGLLSYRNFQDRVEQVAAGDNHCVALTAGGRVFVWGSNSEGQIAANGGNVLKPTEVGTEVFSADTAVKVDANYNNTVVLTAGHKVYASGNNRFGQLGNTNGNSAAFVELTGYTGTARDVAAGNGFIAVATEDGSVYVMGDNQFGQFGNGTRDQVPAQFIEVNLPEGAAVETVACGNKHLFVKMTDGTVYGWGSNIYKQLGAEERFVLAPVKMPAEQVVKIAAYSYGCVMLDQSGAVMIYGSNEKGEWGNGAVSFSSNKNGTKMETIGGGAISEIGAGGSNIVVRTANGAVFSWGSNVYYQTGIAAAAHDDHVLQPAQMDIPLNDIPAGSGSTVELRVNDQPLTDQVVLDAGALFTIDVYISGIQKADTFVLPLKFDPKQLILTNSSGDVLPGGTVTECTDATGFTSYNNSLILQNGYPFVNNEVGLIKLMGRNTTGAAGFVAPTKVCSMTFKGLGKSTASLQPATRETGAVYDYLFPEGPCFGLNDGSELMAVQWDFEQVSAQEIKYSFIEMADFSFQVTHQETVQQNVSELKLDYADREAYTVTAVPDPENASAPGFLWKTPQTNTQKAWSDYITIDQSDRAAVIQIKPSVNQPVTITFPVQGNIGETTVEKTFTLKITKPLPEKVTIGKPADMPEVLTDLETAFTLTATVAPDKTEINKTVVWTVSDASKLQLTPSKDGSTCAIQPLASTGEETVKITASAQDDDTVLDTLDVGIQIAIDSFAVKGEETVLLEVGQSKTLETEILPSVAYVNGEVLWSTWLVGDSNYIDINPDSGMVTAKQGAEGKEFKIRAVLVKDKGLPSQQITQGAVKNIRVVAADAKLFQANIELVNKKAASDLVRITLVDESVQVGDTVCIYQEEGQQQPTVTVPVEGQVTEAELGTEVLQKTGGQLYVSVRSGGTESDKMPVTYEPEKGVIYGNVARRGRSSQANAGVIVTLNGVRTTVTDETGYFCFEDCSPGDYTLVLTSPNYYTRAEIRCTLREDEGIEISSSQSKLELYPGDFDGTGGITQDDTNYYLRNFMGSNVNNVIYQGEDGHALFDSVNFRDEADSGMVESININDLYVVLQCEGKEYREWIIQ